MGIYKNLCEQLLLNQFVRIRSRQFLVAVVEKVINDNKKVSTQRFLQRDFLPCHFIKRNLITNKSCSKSYCRKHVFWKSHFDLDGKDPHKNFNKLWLEHIFENLMMVKFWPCCTIPIPWTIHLYILKYSCKELSI